MYAAVPHCLCLYGSQCHGWMDGWMDSSVSIMNRLRAGRPWYDSRHGLGSSIVSHRV